MSVPSVPAQSASPSVSDYGIIGDLHTAAMVSRTGRIDWLCLPRFDSPACFAALLGTDDNGYWALAPSGDYDVDRRYRPDTLILETEFRTATGTAVLIDFMPPHDASTDLVRIVRPVTGTVDFSTSIKLRFDYGSVIPWVRAVKNGIAAVAGPEAIYIRSGIELQGRDHSTGADFSVTAGGDDVAFVLTRTKSHLDEPAPTDAHDALKKTDEFWRKWAGRCTYDGPAADMVHRSVITLKALTFRPTGGIVAAATTSLPERLGGSRNWDYRYCWLRDATMTLAALAQCGYTAEAVAWRHWLLRAVGGDPEKLQVLYTVDGSRRIPEDELSWLAGFGGSKPVRIGNGAAEQFQLDIFGEVLDALDLARDLGLTQHTSSHQIDSAWSLQKLLIKVVAQRWREPDDGIWEIRGARQHFVHSKVMAWVAFDRMIRGVERNGLDGPVDEWRQTADEIRAEVLAKGYRADLGYFVQSYGSDQVDASLLQIPRVGFLPGDDERVVGTVRAIQDQLTDPAGLIRRYRLEASDNADGLSGTEGSFLVCTFWMVEALAGLGDRDGAEQLFDKVLAAGNDLGLFAEEYDFEHGMQLGNIPQAYSHVGLIAAAYRLGGATGGLGRFERRAADTSTRARLRAGEDDQVNH